MDEFILLTESSGSQGFPVIRALARKMLLLVAPWADLEHIMFVPGDELMCEAMAGNAWKSNKQRQHHLQVALARAIVATLLAPGERFIMLHVDGDRKWSERGCRAEALCPNLCAFESNVGHRVRSALDNVGRPELFQRILFLVPFYSTEAWLFANFTELDALATHDPRGHAADLEQLSAFRGDPGSLEEVLKPKDLLKTFGARFNARLAETLPSRTLYERGLSFAYSVDALRKCGPLMVRLNNLRRW